jgi:hypothetical protein
MDREIKQLEHELGMDGYDSHETQNGGQECPS